MRNNANMKIAIRILMNIFLALILVVTLAVSSPYVGPAMNLTLSALIIALLIVYNIKARGKFSPKIKTVVIIVLLLGCLSYLAIPKKNAACGAVASGAACSSHYCVGLPITAMVNPICLGYKFGEKNWTD